MNLEQHVQRDVMASQTSQKTSSELRSSDLPSRRLIGKGLCGIVYETTLNGKKHARKDFVEVPREIFRDEASALVGLEGHENIVKTYGLTVDSRSCSLVLEYMDDDLLSFLQKRKESMRCQAGRSSENLLEASRLIDSSLLKFIEERRKKPVIPDTSPPPLELQEALHVMLQISTGMAYLHDRKVAHGDLKPRNVLVTYSNEGVKSVKVVDFGLVRTKSKSMFFVSHWARRLDMAQWKAPEYLDMIFGRKLHDMKSLESDSDEDEDTASRLSDYDWLCRADVYSFAVTCFQILTGEVAYPNLNWKELVELKIQSQRSRPELPAAFQSELLNDLLTSCLGDSAQRPTFSAICNKLKEIIQLEITGAVHFEDNTQGRQETDIGTSSNYSGDIEGDLEKGTSQLMQARDFEKVLLPNRGQGIEGSIQHEETGALHSEGSTEGQTRIDMPSSSNYSADNTAFLRKGDHSAGYGNNGQKPPVVSTLKNQYSATAPDPAAAVSGDENPPSVPSLPKAAWDIEHGMGAGVSQEPVPSNLTSRSPPERAGGHLGLTESDIERNEGIDINREDDALQPYYEVKSLLWIKQNTVYSVALEEWDRKVKLLSDRVDKKEKRSGDLKNEIYQVVGFFLVFQGVVLTAVTQLTQSSNEDHNCKKVWSPVILTALAWAVTIVGIWQKLSRIQVIDDERSDEDEARREAVRRANVLRNYGKRFKFSDLKEKSKAPPWRLYCGFGCHFWINRFGGIVVTLSVFTGIFIASHFLILCNRGLAPISP